VVGGDQAIRDEKVGEQTQRLESRLESRLAARGIMLLRTEAKGKAKLPNIEILYRIPWA